MLEPAFLLAIDTCGPTGSVALGRLRDQKVELLGQIELEGRSYSTTLVPAVRDLLAQAGTQLNQLHAIVAVHGPGSFTGVRVGLAAVKGLAEPSSIPVVAISRLEVLAAKAGTSAAALDAHRHEIYLRIDTSNRVPQLPILGAGISQSSVDPLTKELGAPSLPRTYSCGKGGNDELQVPIDEANPDARVPQLSILRPGISQSSVSFEAQELQAGTAELAAIHPAPLQVVLCDDAAAELLASAWPSAELIRLTPPTAADALSACAARIAASEFVDLAELDGHYLRRSDAEIFGTGPHTAPAKPDPKPDPA